MAARSGDVKEVISKLGNSALGEQSQAELKNVSKDFNNTAITGGNAEKKSTGVEVLLTETLRRWVRTVLLTAALPPETREELRRYTSQRRGSATDSPRSRTIPFELVRTVHALQPAGVYLHELLEGSDVHLPEVEIPPRSAELEARVQRLRAEQSQRDYDRMTSNVRAKIQSKSIGDESIGKQLRSMNNQILSFFNFVVTVAGSFAFAYKATEYSMEKPNFATQLLSGLCVATIVFIADLYFLIRYSPD